MRFWSWLATLIRGPVSRLPDYHDHEAVECPSCRNLVMGRLADAVVVYTHEGHRFERVVGGSYGCEHCRAVTVVMDNGRVFRRGDARQVPVELPPEPAGQPPARRRDGIMAPPIT